MSYNNYYDVNILVNGNRCKYYHHQGKTFVEAKYDSEYEIEIKNNTINRVLALTSVDGISVLTGDSASEDDPGYIISPHSPLKIKGFRSSDREVGAFKFTKKNNSYATEVGGLEAEQNCGVIGIKIFNESIKLPNYCLTSSHTTYNYPIVFGSSVDLGQTTTNVLRSTSLCSSNTTNNFDVGTTWGQKIESNVIETNFERGILEFGLDIFYASRNALIEMGIPLNTVYQVSFPQSFPNKYAKPPKGWRG